MTPVLDIRPAIYLIPNHHTPKPYFDFIGCVSWQGPSPDEVALVEGGRRLGFEFLRRKCVLRFVGPFTHIIIFPAKSETA